MSESVRNICALPRIFAVFATSESDKLSRWIMQPGETVVLPRSNCRVYVWTGSYWWCVDARWNE